MAFHIPPAPALTLTEAKTLYDWLSSSPYPKDAYATARDALRKLDAMAHPPTQEKPK